VSFAPTSEFAINASYSVTVSGAIDLAGERQTIVYTSSFSTIDTIAPALTLTTPVPGSWTTNARPTLQIAVDERLSGIDTASPTLTVDGQSVPVALNGSSLSATPSAALTDGQHAVTVTVRDRAGNSGTLAATFGVDTTPPSPAALARVTEGAAVRGTVAISAAATDTGSGVDRIQMFADGILIATAMSPTFQVSYDSHPLSEGTHTFTARAIDVVGNLGSVGPTVHGVVDNQ